MPWEEKPAGCIDPVWRFSKNPIIGRHAVACANSVFNSAVVPFQGVFAGVFRVDDRARNMRLHAGRSANGIDWKIENDPIEWIVPDGVEPPEYGYDPRVCRIGESYYVSWCSGFRGPAVALGKTSDFERFEMIENAMLPFNRNGVLFPKKIKDDYLLLSRPSDPGHTPFGEIFISRSRNLTDWGRHRFVMSGTQPWESTKIGAGPIPIETTAGWLLFYHGVLTSCNGFVYHFGAALLDANEPWKLLKRTRRYLLSPQAEYECIGDVPNVVFPCAALADSETGRIAVYYGAADTVVCLAFTTLGDVLDWMD